MAVGILGNCVECGGEFTRKSKDHKFCSPRCRQTGIYKRNYVHKGNSNLGIKTKLLWQDPEYRKRMSDAHKGKIHAGTWKKGHAPSNTGRTRFKKGQVGTRLGKKNSDEHKRKLILARKGKPSPKTRNENNWQWKGLKASYSAVHGWIRRRFGKANRCDNSECRYPRMGKKGKMLQSPKVFDWANKSGKYLHDRKDWMMLCRSCHMIHDKANNVSIPHNWENRASEDKINEIDE